MATDGERLEQLGSERVPVLEAVPPVPIETFDSPLLEILFAEDAAIKTYSAVDILRMHDNLTGRYLPLASKETEALAEAGEAGLRVEKYLKEREYVHGRSMRVLNKKIEAGYNARQRLVEGNLSEVIATAINKADNDADLLRYMRAGSVALIDAVHSLDTLPPDVSGQKHITESIKAGIEESAGHTNDFNLQAVRH